MSGINFTDLMKSTASKMLIDFESSQNISHPGVKGHARESIVLKEFLRKYLPNRYGIGSGIIIDANSKESKQQDLVIYDEFYSPIFLDFESDKYFFTESIFAVIEVKSKLDSSNLGEMVRNSASVWSLEKNSPSTITIYPNLTIPGVNIPILCVGFCFESTIGLKDIPDKVRKELENDENSLALSAICVLKDKNGESGVIVNTTQEDIFQIQIIPSITSRIGSVKFNDAGSALLFIYTIIFEHLRLAGSISSGPNLLNYFAPNDSNHIEIHLSTNEMKGTLLNLDGNKVKVDDLSRIRELSIKMTTDRNLTDEEILEFFHLFPKIPSGNSFQDPRSKIYIDNRLADLPPSSIIYKAIKRHFENHETMDDKELLKKFVELIKSYGITYKELRIGFNNK